MQNQYRLGIDAGGTFTDFILADRKGGVRIFKALSTPNDPTAAIRNGLRLIQEETGLSPEKIVSNADLCINGTTVGLNALITHNGARTGLIATRGHEDSIEEVDSCVDLVNNKTAEEPQARRKWAYACASVLSSASFLTY